MTFDSTKDWAELIVAILSIAGFIYTSWKFILLKICEYFYSLYVNKIKFPIINHFKKIDKMVETSELINNEILPVIQSLNREFSKNSGKSIMDRILRIDDNTRLSELKTKMMADNLVKTGVIEFDKFGNLTWANKAFLDFVGSDLDSMKDNGWAISIVEDDRDQVWKLWQNSIKNDIPFESEYFIKNQDNHQQIKVRCVIQPHKSMDNTILGYYGTVVTV